MTQPGESITGYRKDLKRLIVALIYPAVLGATFLVLVLKLLEPLGETPGVKVPPFDWLSAAFTVVLLGYFSISYLVTDDEEKKYGVSQFLFDAIEAALVLVMFWALGFADPAKGSPTYAIFFAALFWVTIVQAIWHRIRYGKISDRFVSVLLSCLIAAFGFLIHSSDPQVIDARNQLGFSQQIPTWIDWVLFGGLALLLGLYIWYRNTRDKQT